MGNLRPALIIGLVFLGYMIWVQWQKDYGPAPKPPEAATSFQSDAPAIPATAPTGSTGTDDLPQPMNSPGQQSPDTSCKRYAIAGFS